MLGPFKQTKAFFGRQTAFISNTLSFGSSSVPLALNMQHFASVPLPLLSSSLLSLPFSIMPDRSIRRSRPIRCTKLQASTDTDVEGTPVKEKRIKKVRRTII